MVKLTDELLEGMGIIPIPSHLQPNRYLVISLEINITIHPSTTLKDLIPLICEEYYKRGLEDGKSLKAKEIREILGIKEI